MKSRFFGDLRKMKFFNLYRLKIVHLSTACFMAAKREFHVKTQLRKKFKEAGGSRLPSATSDRANAKILKIGKSEVAKIRKKSGKTILEKDIWEAIVTESGIPEKKYKAFVKAHKGGSITKKDRDGAGVMIPAASVSRLLKGKSDKRVSAKANLAFSLFLQYLIDTKVKLWTNECFVAHVKTKSKTKLKKGIKGGKKGRRKK